MPEVGAGQYRYQVVDNWGSLPLGWTFGVVTGVTVDSPREGFTSASNSKTLQCWCSIGKGTTSTPGGPARLLSLTRFIWDPTT